MKRKLFEHIDGNKFKLTEASALPTISTTITHPITQEEIDVTVEYDYTPPERGERESGTGLQLTPDYPEDLQIISVMDNDGNDYIDKLSKNDLNSIEDTIYNKMDSDRENAEEKEIDDFEDRKHIDNEF